MSFLRYQTAGESHGKGITVLIEGLPFGLEWDEEFVNRALARRQGGYGRSKRQQIEKDRVQVLGGLKKNRTTGGPLALFIENQDHSIDQLGELTTPRPGHADLAGCLKYETHDIRAVLERASARETVGRVAAGASAALLLREFNIQCFAHVIEVGGVAAKSGSAELAKAAKFRDRSPFYSLDFKTDSRMRRAVDRAAKEGDSLGGVFEVWVEGAPAGLGGYATAEQRLNARLGAALLSIQAIKGVEVGLGFESARIAGSEVHDEIFYRKASGRLGFYRKTNRSGGIEGGISTGERIVLRAAMKPISTLPRGLRTVDLKTKKPTRAVYQRSDVCAVPAASVVGEFAVAFEIARAFMEKFGSDSLTALSRNFNSYKRALQGF